MVFTRGQRPLGPAAIDNDVLSTQDLDIDVKPAVAPGKIPHALNDVTPKATEGGRTQDDGRLRKRRRSPSPTAIGQEPSSKRSNPRKAPSPIAKRTATTNVNARASREKVASTITRRGRRIADQGMQNAAPQGAEGEGHGVLEQEPPAPQWTAGPEGPGELGEASDMAQISPDMNAVMSRIISHGQTMDGQHALHSDPSASADTEGIFPRSASSILRNQSLPVLDNLAVQVLATFANSSYQEILALTSDNTTEPGAAYSTLKSLFDHTKKVYSITEPFLSSQALGFNGNEQVEIIRKANLATFVSSVFGSQDVGFYHLNEFFLDAFVADGSRLLKNQAGLFLDLKTQAYISAISNGERSREDILHDLIPDDLEQSLLNRRPGGKQPSPGEADFLQRAINRKKTLLEEPMTAEAVAQLPQKYAWEDFLRDISSYISKNFNTIVGASGRTIAAAHRSANLFETDLAQQPRRQTPRNPPQGPLVQEQDAAPPAANAFTPRVAQMLTPDADSITAMATRAAELAMQDFSVNQDTAASSQQSNDKQPQQQPQQYPFHFEQQPAPYYTQNQFTNGPQLLQQQQQQQPVDMGQAQNMYMNAPPVPYPTQSAPTSVLYERARMAATAKASPSNRRAGHPSQRRPWNREEEAALMAGLDHVKGPHWSQILAMYGAGGTIDESLKDRNQVQLKDKARNLKLFFLKSGIEVPYYLQFVTGELKTRAPQVARQVEERGQSATHGDATIHESEGPPMHEGVHATDGAGERMLEQQDTNTEDGEGEMIDPGEYAAVHGAGDQGAGTGRGSQDTVYPDARQQLSQAAQ
ncbi:MAG: hypothetical protein Q9208_000235 [Pyrenodesmia sp. 3 TL-2023]